MAGRLAMAPDAALVSALIDHLPIGIVVLDAAGRVLCVNRHERKMARRYVDDAVGRDFFVDVAPCFDVRGLAGAFRDGIARDEVRIETEVSFRFEHMPAPREVRLSITSFAFGGSLLAAVCLQDLGESREYERRRDVIAAAAVHDIRTPLTTVVLELEAALRVIGRNAGARALVESARESVDHAARLASSGLDALRVARGDGAEARIEVDLVVLAGAALRILRPLARTQGVELALGGDAGVALRCEAGLVRRALENLLDNAVRTAPEGSKVELLVTATPGGARVAVVDRGPGVAPERRAEIFELGRTSGEGPSNFGLGLALVALVAERQGGSARVEETPGGGATFVLELRGDEPEPGR